jgi:hypothetical protein
MSSSPFPPDQSPIKVLTDDDGRSLHCSVEQSITSKGVQYYLLKPINYPVSIIMWDEDEDAEQAILIEDEREIDKLFPKAAESLAEEALMLQRTSFTLTVEGELPEPDDDDILILEIETERALEEEEFQLLATFYYHDQEYRVYTPLVPLLFLVKVQSNGELELLSLDESEMILPILEEWR